MKPLINHVGDKPTGLRDSENVCKLRVERPSDREWIRVTFRIVSFKPEKGNRIPYRRQTQSHPVSYTHLTLPTKA